MTDLFGHFACWLVLLRPGNWTYSLVHDTQAVYHCVACPALGSFVRAEISFMMALSHSKLSPPNRDGPVLIHNQSITSQWWWPVLIHNYHLSMGSHLHTITLVIGFLWMDWPLQLIQNIGACGQCSEARTLRDVALKSVSLEALQSILTLYWVPLRGCGVDATLLPKLSLMSLYYHPSHFVNGQTKL